MGTAAPVEVRVRIPSQIRRLYGAQAWEPMTVRCVGDVIVELERRYPGMGERLSEPGGALRRWVNVFVDGEDVRNLAGPATPLAAGAEVQIVPSVAGG